MQRKLSFLWVVLVIFFWVTSTVAAETVTLVGEVNDTFQIVADNEIYEVAVNPIGEKLVLKFIAQKVKVVGQVKEQDEVKTITVEFFEVVEE